VLADDDGYEGPATLVLDGRSFEITVRLGGRFQPLDGRYRWYGRVAADGELTAVVGDRTAQALLRTPEGTAEGRLGEADLWNRYRIEGTGLPPFRVPFSIADVTAD
jgi:hypothetical protein